MAIWPARVSYVSLSMCVLVCVGLAWVAHVFRELGRTEDGRGAAPAAKGARPYFSHTAMLVELA